MKVKVIIIMAILLTTGYAYGQSKISSKDEKKALSISGGLSVGTKAPELKVEEWLSEVPDLKGKFVALDFWGPSCKPCIAGFPHVNELHRKFQDKVIFIAATTNDRPGDVYTFEAGTPIAF